MNMPPDDETITVRKVQRFLVFKGDPQGRRLTRKLRKRHPDLVRFRQPGNVAETTIGAIRRWAPDLLPKPESADKEEALRLLRIIKDRIDEECDSAVANAFDRRVAPALAALPGFAAELERLRKLVEGK